MAITTANVINLGKLYGEVFGRHSYKVDEPKPINLNITYSGISENDKPRGFKHKSLGGQVFNKTGAYGQDIWFPVELCSHRKENGKLEKISVPIDICTVSVNRVTTIVNTSVVERKGTVTEIINHEDYKFTIRGFLVGENRTVPEKAMKDLVAIQESMNKKMLYGAYPEMFLDKSCQIVISELEFPEVQGQNHWIRPFSLQCKSDFITELELP
ncbi:DUF6046 domain-containing protein [Chryseobacterium sp.]|uniref:DUF6046 domain-containing protein n=1 Tax=Chryseobacterium sp. TaxID=1871047 RepID=UPI0028975A66|nr:DUF6046 domain-containing protein [Chryseobacterium sp.]